MTASSPAAEIATQDVTYTHEGTELKGYLAWDASQQGKRPGVLIVHEWWGLNDYARTRAQELARMGYVAFALDMYGGGKVTEQPTQAMEWSGAMRSNKDRWRDRALAGLQVLKQQPQVDGDRVAAIGYCFGGSTVLQLAFADAPLKGVVSFHGALTPPPAESAIHVKVLVCHGAADSSIPPASVDAFEFGMLQAKADFTIAIFGKARHGFTNPDAGKYGIENLAYNAEADHRSWAYMKLFFDELFAPPKTK
jgi:dienelactone hydrolase